MRKLLIILFLLLSGCASNRAYDSKMLKNSQGLKHYAGISNVNSSVISNFFTEEAQQALSNIPVVDGIMIQPFVVGANEWSTLAGIITFNGFSRKIVIDEFYFKEEITERTVIHEYIHHLDSMDRNGEGEWISHREFALALHRLLQDPYYHDILKPKIEISDAFITNVFGIGVLSEEIAYVGSWVAIGEAPNYISHVFRKMLKAGNKK